MRDSQGIASRFSISAACRSVAQSDWLPITMPTSGGEPSGAVTLSSGNAVGNQVRLQPGDLILQQQLALLQPLQMQLVGGILLRQPGDDGVEVAVFAAQLRELAQQRVAVSKHSPIPIHSRTISHSQ